MKRILLKKTILSKKVILLGIDFIHSQIQELAESLMSTSNVNQQNSQAHILNQLYSSQIALT